MKSELAASLVFAGISTASAQQFVAHDTYRTCPQDQTQKGQSIVEEVCGRVARPDFSTASFSNLEELRAAERQRDQFAEEVADYGACITDFINSYRQPGANANSTAPDEAACAHAWAEDQITQTIIEYGRACIAFSNRSVTTAAIAPWSGACYPSAPPEKS